MPFYTYECMNCGKLADIVCEFSEKEKHEKDLLCGTCGSRHFNQQFRLTLMSDGSSSGSKSCASDSCGCCNGCD